MCDELDALLVVGEDKPFLVLNRLEASPSRPSVGGMNRFLTRLEIIEGTGVLRDTNVHDAELRALEIAGQGPV